MFRYQPPDMPNDPRWLRFTDLDEAIKYYETHPFTAQDMINLLTQFRDQLTNSSITLLKNIDYCKHAWEFVYYLLFDEYPPKFIYTIDPLVE
jgi:hypothetical protein